MKLSLHLDIRRPHGVISIVYAWLTQHFLGGFMKVLGFSLVAMSSLFAINSAFAHSIPADLEDLSHRWSTVATVDDSSVLMSMEYAYHEDVDSLYKDVHSSLEAYSGLGQNTISMSYSQFKEKSRSILLARVFPQGEKDLLFCKAFPSTHLKIGKSCTDKELNEKKEKATFANCQKKVKELLGGILHTDPEIHLGEMKFENGRSHLVFYVRSVLDAQSYMKFHFVK